MEFTPHRTIITPPMCKQRYERVTEILNKMIQSDSNSTVIEAGCSHLKLHVYLKELTSIARIIYLDLDEFILEKCKTRLCPTTKDYVVKRTYKLTAEVYAGCITKPDATIINSKPDALVAIELIEHLDPEILIGFEQSVFQKIRPRIVIVTTPNFEYNELFELNGNFRHWDHRFEWTRSEFNSWCQRISDDYGYEFKTDGVGGDGTEEYGFVTQIAIFQIKVGSNLVTRNAGDDASNESYKLIARVSYPWESVENKILGVMKEYVKNLEPGDTEITLSQVLEMMPDELKSLEQISNALEKEGHNLRNNKNGEMCVFVQIPEPPPIDPDNEWTT